MQQLLGPKRLRERGDTIVEVLIATAVISLVLASSYAITNRNTATTRDTQEHNQAQQLAQQQIEGLRAIPIDTRDDLSLSATGCVLVTESASVFKLNPSDTECTFTDGGVVGCSEEPCYKVTVTKEATAKYVVLVSWNSVKGDTSQVSLVYGI